MNYSVNGRSEKYQGSKLSVDPTCGICGARKDMAGPIWNSKLHDREFIDLVLNNLKDTSSKFGTTDRIEGMLCVCKEVRLWSALLFSQLVF